jgi:hypothetical protein
MQRFAVVDDMLLRGSAPNADDLMMLKNLWGVKNILSLDEDVGMKISPICRRLGLKQLIVPVWFGDSEHTKILAQIIPSLSRSGPTYVHCYHGQDRTGMAVAMYRVANGWPLTDALREAAKHGMGMRFIEDSPEIASTYYDAVRDFAKGAFDYEEVTEEDLIEDEEKPEAEADVNEARADIVELQRDAPASPGLTQNPAINDERLPTQWFPTSMPRHDYPILDPFIRPAAQKVYRKCSRSTDVLTPKQWWWTRKEAVQGEGTMYSAVISSSADIEKFKRSPDQAMMRSAMLHDKDVASFMDKLFFVINPDSLVNIEELDSPGDVVPEKGKEPQQPLTVGQHDNYTGMAQNVFPGSSGYGYDGGVTGSGGYGAAGFAGTIFGPQTGLDQ